MTTIRPCFLANARAAALCALFVATSSDARADAIGPCPDGEEVVMNPSTPGSMHHGGFHCERRGGCSIAAPSAGRVPSAVGAASLGLVALALATRRR